MTKTQTLIHGLIQMVLQGIIWGAPVLLNLYPGLGNLTISAILGTIVAWAHIEYLTA